MPILSSAFRRILPVLLMAAPVPAEAACRGDRFEGSAYTVCSFDLRQADLRTFWRNADGQPYRSFAALADDLRADGLTLQFAMNGGMYQKNLTPVGLYLEKGRVLREANLADAPAHLKPVPNFYKKPNGVFHVQGTVAGITETAAFTAAGTSADFATQSGPLLLIDGAIHPAFIPGSTDLNPRNGVGVTGPHEVHFVISEDEVNFHDFARYFRDVLGCRDALFLDGGSASGLYAVQLGRNDWPPWGGYGPLIGVVE